jgi:FXSXX-COOH protein
MTGIKIADLASMSPALSRSMQRLVRSLDDPNGVISAFSSFVESPR